MNRLTVLAPAKINLHLQVTSAREDGFHEVWTVFQSIDLADRVSAHERSDGRLVLEIEPAGAAPGGRDNLVLQAASALRERGGVNNGAAIHLLKRIPVGAGLGGGSADAAATLVVLDRLWGLNLDCSVLEEIASEIGSDVRFFLHGGLALGRGRGDEISPLPDIRSRGVVVVMPELRISTAEAFEELSARLTSRWPDATVEAFVAARREAGTGDPPWGSLSNDFEEVVTQRWPEIGRLTSAVRATGPLHAAITGSGAAVFGIYADQAAACKAAQEVGRDWRVHVGSMLGNRRAGLLDREGDPREEEKRWK